MNYLRSMSQEEITELVTRELTNLGSNVDEVVASLLAKEIKGGRGSTNCPIAKFLMSLFEDARYEEITVSTITMSFHFHTPDRNCVTGSIALPQPVQEFIDGFDNRKDEKFTQFLIVGA